MFIFVTDAGRQLAHELVPVATDFNRQSLAGFAANEVELLMNLLLRLQRNLRSLE